MKNYIVMSGSYWNGERLKVEGWTYIRVLRSGLTDLNDIRLLLPIVSVFLSIIIITLLSQILIQI
ncbi:MAG: hypothetical protein QXK72_04995 [Candidatus Bathyarchaeia archaeon]|nr:hypothetical protein [Candidatus Bathyarchaeota archaeon]